MIEIVKLEEALGCPLAHDITAIRPGEFKGPAFLKGHILTTDDLEPLRRMGKEHLYVLKIEKGQLHEDQAALRLAKALCGAGAGWEGDPREGKIEIRAQHDGLLKVDVAALAGFNLGGDVMCATLHDNTVVRKGVQVAGTRAIPLVVAEDIVAGAERAASEAENGVLRVLPFRKAKVGLMITGNEVYEGRIEDKFEPVIRQKIGAFDGEVVKVHFLPDDDEKIATAARDLLSAGADLIISTGGMSVDPDDRSRYGLQKAGVQDMVYGAPVLPGAMFMVGYAGAVAVLGIPACGMYMARTVLDLIYPRVLAGERLTRKDVARLGHGGLCLGCQTCTFPVCPFGK